MPYTRRIDSNHPACFLVLLDQSGSMAGDFPAGTGPGAGSLPKAQAVADAVNRIFQQLVLTCASGSSFKDRFHLGVVAYGEGGAALPGGFTGLKSISELASTPLRVETRGKQVPDGAGGLVEQTVRFPIWFEPRADGGTPMKAATDLAYGLLEPWVQANPDSFPPVVINITDGESTDGDPGPGFERIRTLATSDGHVLVFNLLLSERACGGTVAWPTDPSAVPAGPLRSLVEASSELPEIMRSLGQKNCDLPLAPGCRGVVLNGSFQDVVKMLKIGTLPGTVAGNDAA